jgi:hypothetical protein
MGDRGRLHTRTTLYRFSDSVDGEIERLGHKGVSIEELIGNFKEQYKGFKVVEDNKFLDEGINTMWTLVCGGAATPFNNVNAHIGVGDGTTPVSHNQTGLQGVNKSYKQVDYGYPTFGYGNEAIFRATFGPEEATFAWQEWTIANGNSDSAMNINRKVENLGTKPVDEAWILLIELSMD